MQNPIRFLCAILIATAVALLIYSLAVDVKEYRAPAGIDFLLATPTECAAWGGGLLVFGLLLLVMFGGRSQGFDKPGKP
jgi:hypothetical protein